MHALSEKNVYSDPTIRLVQEGAVQAYKRQLHH